MKKYDSLDPLLYVLYEWDFVADIVAQYSDPSRSLLERLQSLFIVIPRGFSPIRIGRKVTEKLQDLQCIPFNGTEAVYFRLQYNKSEDHRLPVRQLRERLLKACGHRQTYTGVLLLDITEWLNQKDLDGLRPIIGFLSDNRKNFYSLFLAENDENSTAIYPILAKLCGVFPLQCLTIKMMPPIIAFNKCAHLLAENNIDVDETVYTSMMEYIEQVVTYIDNYDEMTIQTIADDIIGFIYRRYRSRFSPNKRIDMKDWLAYLDASIFSTIITEGKRAQEIL